ncbi:NAD(P)/FAD-dependent oxidoreductase [Kordiimonas aquimaris]|uniref:NAD(P)/FAD-dependent oxidoreductase n=1 Tax=Kordiimonas aquimaris TaxID=707591 RepID=UPI0021D37215|nr:FAD-binding oxidoreductase [Kordiimonas aquimaris]
MTIHTSPTQHAEHALQTAQYKPYWLDSSKKPNTTPSLNHDETCDLLIVGAGFCGLWAALQAKETDPERHIIMIEAGEVANGATGRPAAILSTSVMHGIDNTERMFPDEVATLEQLGMDNMDGFEAAIKKYKIDCDLEWGGELTVAVGEQELPQLQHEKELFDKYGHETQLLNRTDLQDEITSPIFDGGLMIKKRSGTVHPGKLAWGLKHAVLELGVVLYENTKLISTKKTATGINVKTPSGTITARKVLLCTNAFAAGHKNIRRKVVAIRDRIVVTEPLSTEQMAKVGWKSRCGIYDTRTQLNYMRLTADNRILFGGRLGYFYGNDTDPDADKQAKPFIPLVENFFKTFPQLDDVKIDYAWSGPIGLTTRMAVHYQSYHGGDMVFAGGYSGFGVTATRFGARVGLDILDNKDTIERKLTFAQTQPGYVPGEPLRWLGFKITMYALDTLDAKGGWRKLWVRIVEKMGFPITMH